MEKFGIHISMLVAQIINFSVMVVVLTKVLYKPILTMLDERKKKIEEGLRLTETLREEKEKIEKERKKILTQTEEEGRKILEKAMHQAKERSREYEDEEKRKLHRELERIKADLEQERGRMIEQATKHALKLGVQIAEKILNKEFSRGDAKNYLKYAIKNLDKEISA